MAILGRARAGVKAADRQRMLTEGTAPETGLRSEIDGGAPV